MIVTTDLIVRSERWAALKERSDRYPPTDFDARRPWDYVIAVSVYGSHDLRVQAWWQRMFVLPATLTSSSGAASSLVALLDGGQRARGCRRLPGECA